MKIKGKLLIPVIAIIIAMFTLGITPGASAETTISESVSDSLTFVSQEVPTTQELGEKVEGMVSEMFGDQIKDAEEPIRSFSEMMASFLDKIRTALSSIIEFLQAAGGALGEGNLLGGGLLS